MTSFPQNHDIRFKIIAQNRGDELEIEIVGQGLHMKRTARELLKQPDILRGFAPEDIAAIGLAAGMMIAAWLGVWYYWSDTFQKAALNRFGN